MDFDRLLTEVSTLLERERRVSWRGLRRRFQLNDEDILDLKAELIDARRVAVDEDGTVLVWRGAEPAGPVPPSPASYTPRHLAERILRERSALVGERKEVTVLFVDVKGSLELARQLGEERWHGVLDGFFAELTAGVHRYEGTINQYTGDGIMALFGAPVAHEDHALRACHAALDLRERLEGFAHALRGQDGIEFGVRMGLNSGVVVVGAIGDDLRMDYTAQGEVVGLAQRLENLAPPGAIYLGAAVARRVRGYFELRPVGEATVAGLAEAVEVLALESTRDTQSRLAVAGARGFTPFVGRDSELDALGLALERARGGQGQVVGLVGDAGIGKSRLCLEFVERCRAAGVPIFRAHCLAHARNLPFVPMLELFRDYFGVGAGDDAAAVRGRIATALVGLGPPASEALPILYEFMGVDAAGDAVTSSDADTRQRRLFALMRALYRERAERGQCAVVLIDDVHWIDPASDAFLAEMVAATVEHSRNLLLLNFRPEYQAPWMRRAHYQQLALAPMGTDASRRLVERLLGSDPSLTGLAEQVAEWSGGNPFFVEEIVRELVETGALTGPAGDHALVAPVSALPVPADVRALLAARLDRLPAEAKQALQLAAVIGRVFARDLLGRAWTERHGAGIPLDLDGALALLAEGEFVREDAHRPGEACVFKHPLTQEVALASLLGEQRARLHAAVATALAALHAGQLDEHAALLAAHSEAAGDAWAAARWHRRAAEWVGLKDVAASFRHWQQAVRLSRAAPQVAEADAFLATACARALASGWRLGGGVTDWAEVYGPGCAAAQAACEHGALVRLHAAYSIERALNQGVVADYVTYSERAVAIADELGDAALRCGARAPLVLGLGYCGDLRRAEHVADEVIALAAGDYDLGHDVVGFSPLLTARFARARLLAFRHDTVAALRELPRVHQAALEHGYPEQALWIIYGEAEARYHAGHFEGARGLADAARWLVARLGVGNELMGAMAICMSLACESDWPALEAATERAIDLIETSGAMRPVVALFRGLRGTALAALGDLPGARVQARRGVDYMRESACYINPHAYGVLARLDIALGAPAAGLTALLDEYGLLLERTGYGLFEGELEELRGSLAAREGDRAAAGAAFRRAGAIYGRFGMAAAAARVRAAL